MPLPSKDPVVTASAAPRPTLKPLEDALTELLDSVTPLAALEQLSCFDADGRVLRADLVSELQVPPHDNSAMDGYALRSADVAVAGTLLPVSQRVPAGHVGQPLQPGTAARIFTGAPVPAGADAVVPQELCEQLGHAGVRVNTVVQAGMSIRYAGEDVRLGQTVLASGERLNCASLGLAASIGAAHLTVSARPRVALFSTGDELVMPGEVAPAAMPPGAIYNSNRFFLRALLQRLGCVVQDFGVVPDNRDATVRALAAAAEGNDVVLTSGGVSAGEEDHVRPAVQSLGTLDLWQVAIKPGKPFAHGRIGAAHVVGLPGNPVASYITFLLLVRPLLLKLQGARQWAVKPVYLPAHFEWPRADRRREFLRVRRDDQGGLALYANQGSGVLTSVVWGNGLVDNPPGQSIRHGDAVRFLPFSDLLG